MSQVIVFPRSKKRGPKVRTGPVASVTRIHAEPAAAPARSELLEQEERLAQMFAERHFRMRAERAAMFARTSNLIDFPRSPKPRPIETGEGGDEWVDKTATRIVTRAKEIIAEHEAKLDKSLQGTD